VRQVGYLQGSYQDARPKKHKKNKILIGSLVEVDVHNMLNFHPRFFFQSPILIILFVRILPRCVQSFTVSKLFVPSFTNSFSWYGCHDTIINFVFFFPSISTPILFVHSTSDVNTSSSCNRLPTKPRHQQKP